jgi:ketosteroid isomerase-like protein
MSQENVERYRQSIDAWNRGVLDEWLDTVTPGWELVPAAGAFLGLAPIYRGREGALEVWNTLRGPWDQGLHIDIERIEDLGDTFVALFTMRARGERSGAETAIKWAHVVTFRGQDSHIRSYADWAEALEAVGLRE